ncbi:unnamed protein product [Prunus brigantina]
MAEKVNFAQTCNLLSQYLKEKRSLQVPTTMNLLTNMETSPAAETPSSKPSIDLFPQFAKNPEAVVANQPGSAPMTIFYGGHVLVFNDLQAEKAREIMGLATKGSSKIYSGFVSNGVDKFGSASVTNMVASEPNIAANSQDIQKVQPQVIGSDLPIARRASLHKFLAKRKERVAAIAPYQVNYQRASPSKSEEEMSSRDQVEGQSSKQLELRLY